MNYFLGPPKYWGPGCSPVRPPFNTPLYNASNNFSCNTIATFRRAELTGDSQGLAVEKRRGYLYFSPHPVAIHHQRDHK